MSEPQQLFEDLLARGRRLSHAYELRARASRRLGLALRSLALVLGAGASMAPVIADLAGRQQWTPVTLVLVGLAGVCVWIDRLHGYSRGWMRHLETHVDLERCLHTRRLQWPEQTERAGQLRFLREWNDEQHRIVSRDTQAMIKEAAQQLTELEESTSKSLAGSSSKSV